MHKRPQRSAVLTLYLSHFDTAFEELQAYKTKYGTTNVKKADDLDLYKWTRWIKSRKNAGKLCDEYVERLDSIGFKWIQQRPLKLDVISQFTLATEQVIPLPSPTDDAASDSPDCDKDEPARKTSVETIDLSPDTSTTEAMFESAFKTMRMIEGRTNVANEKKRVIEEEEEDKMVIQQESEGMHVEEEPTRELKRKSSEAEEQSRKNRRIESYAQRILYPRDGQAFMTIHSWLSNITATAFIDLNSEVGLTSTERKIPKKLLYERFIDDTKINMHQTTFGTILKIIYPKLETCRSSQRRWNRAPCYVIDIPLLMKILAGVEAAESSSDKINLQEKRMEDLRTRVIAARRSLLDAFKSMAPLASELGIDPEVRLIDMNGPFL